MCRFNPDLMYFDLAAQFVYPLALLKQGMLAEHAAARSVTPENEANIVLQNTRLSTAIKWTAFVCCAQIWHDVILPYLYIRITEHAG